MDGIFGQHDHAVRFDWGLPGALAVAADVCVVVDVLSFSTSVTIAVERGMQVFPFAWKDERAASYAARLGAVLAVGRRRRRRWRRLVPPCWPGACATPAPSVVTSPNTWMTGGRSRWSPQGRGGTRTTRCARALEDHWGAGAVLSTLVRLGYGTDLSTEARAAVALWDTVGDQPVSALHACVGGRELAAKGFSADVDVAAALDRTTAVPVLLDGAFLACPTPPSPSAPTIRA